MINAVALVTPSYRGDVERLELLCESVDRFVTGYDRHYVIVNDDDLALFAPFDSNRRVVLPSSNSCLAGLNRCRRLYPAVDAEPGGLFAPGPSTGGIFSSL